MISYYWINSAISKDIKVLCRVLALHKDPLDLGFLKAELDRCKFSH